MQTGCLQVCLIRFVVCSVCPSDSVTTATEKPLFPLLPRMASRDFGDASQLAALGALQSATSADEIDSVKVSDALSTGASQPSGSASLSHLLAYPNKKARTQKTGELV